MWKISDRHKAVAVCAGTVLAAGLIGTLDGSAHASGMGGEMLTQQCRMCHELATVTMRRASPEEWREIVQRMITYGAQVPDMDLMVDYLSTHFGPE